MRFALFISLVLFCVVLLAELRERRQHVSDCTARIKKVEQDLATTEYRNLALESQLPCAPAFAITCDPPSVVLFKDGERLRFRYAIEGVDLGVVRCFLESGTEVFPE